MRAAQQGDEGAVDLARFAGRSLAGPADAIVGLRGGNEHVLEEGGDVARQVEDAKQVRLQRVLWAPFALDDDQVVEQLGEVVAAELGLALLPLPGETLAERRRAVADQFGLQLVGLGLAQAACLRAGVGVACLFHRVGGDDHQRNLAVELDQASAALGAERAQPLDDGVAVADDVELAFRQLRRIRVVGNVVRQRPQRGATLLHPFAEECCVAVARHETEIPAAGPRQHGMKAIGFSWVLREVAGNGVDHRGGQDALLAIGDQRFTLAAGRGQKDGA